MTIIDQERIVIFRRILDHKLEDISDEDLLVILNAAILPNAISITAFKYSLTTSFIFNKAETEKAVKKITLLESVLSKIEKNLFKFGVIYGFDSYNADYQYTRFISHSLNMSKSINRKNNISSAYFQKIFYFIYSFIYKGEKNERYPRI